MKNKFLHDQRKMDNPVGVTWEVAADTFSYLADRDYFEKGSGLLKAYNEKMTALQNAYRAARGGIEKNTCYVFVLNYSGGDNDRNTAGFMPRGKQFGYIAHELVPAIGYKNYRNPGNSKKDLRGRTLLHQQSGSIQSF